MNKLWPFPCLFLDIEFQILFQLKSVDLRSTHTYKNWTSAQCFTVVTGHTCDILFSLAKRDLFFWLYKCFWWPMDFIQFNHHKNTQIFEFTIWKKSRPQFWLMFIWQQFSNSLHISNEYILELQCKFYNKIFASSIQLWQLCLHLIFNSNNFCLRKSFAIHISWVVYYWCLSFKTIRFYL